ncbi:regulatory protein RecX [Tenacibaculum maritimum]|uniref:Regulatory protein RecX n=2 Tax=Tenacibaculum maritimum TaxID=107401 RepID=A0A2H1E680_9FLAO|nr:regulatory protein RecX [Tenacibaculum maritimum]MCD9626396.1 RecX family transcriptional regulator [Tenacibaculum maritimum]MCD9628971.1 RecX family transcriptional regulator [Tenacibaculum maritimum]MCD9631718.1 RecX family transcriptional regulator [Tenacibaculum maritimum]QCD61124.1 recombinase RecX [Tenacibaculum maritimum]CAA0247817.1 Regulatory protein RecX [Tenacibaculum maritimum]
MSKQVFSVNEIKRKMESFCVYQDRCHKEVEKKIAEYNLIPEARASILIDLIQDGFLNEERFAKSFARGKFRIKKWGKQRITRELKLRDVSSYNIRIALKEIDENDYMATLYELITKRNNSISETNLYKRKKKIMDYMVYRGYEYELLFMAINDFLKEK